MVGIEDRLLAEVPQLIWVTDAEGSIVYVNRKYADYTGYSSEELCGQTEWRKALHPDDLERCLHDWRAATTAGMGYETEYRLRRASDASWRWHLARALPIKDGHGRVVKWVGSCTDIEEQKRLQESLRLSEERILEESRRKDEFLAMLGHELRNPLAPIVGAVGLLRLRDTARTDHLDIIERQARHMARLVDDLLDVARISCGSITLRRERTALTTVVERAVEIAMPIVREHAHTLIVDVARDAIIVDVDPIRIAQVLANMLNNAAKYTPRAGTITIRALRDGNDAVLSVRDTGIGIAVEQLPHVFDLFVQGERALDRSQGGLGVGLTLVRRIVEMHEGSVTASSDGLGRGSEFVVRLPIAIATLAAVEVPAIAAPTMFEPTGRRVLVVDDNQDIINVLLDYLTWKGFDVHVSFDGPSALTTAAEIEPDVVILDIGLPQLDGYEVARRLRADARFAATRLIALTGYGQRADLERAMAAGFHDHLVKPIDFDKLVRLLSTRQGPVLPGRPVEVLHARR